MRRYLRDPTFSRFDTMECDRHTHTDTQTDTRRWHIPRLARRRAVKIHPHNVSCNSANKLTHRQTNMGQHIATANLLQYIIFYILLICILLQLCRFLATHDVTEPVQVCMHLSCIINKLLTYLTMTLTCNYQPLPRCV